MCDCIFLHWMLPSRSNICVRWMVCFDLIEACRFVLCSLSNRVATRGGRGGGGGLVIMSKGYTTRGWGASHLQKG